MGEVYLARDTKTGKLAALKLLPPEFADDTERLRRFEQEALATSALKHEHIVAIYEVGLADLALPHGKPGRLPFLAMEFVEGGTLRHRMSLGRMSVGEALDITVQVAEALSAAHAYGVVHRDVKPENIMLGTDDRIKLLDFGLAKLTEPLLFQLATPDASTLSNLNTGQGEVLGTVNYISPEQVRGLSVDGQTDVWSLGVLLYEMLTGELPFSGGTTGEKIVSILEREPPLMCWADLPERLARIIAKALAKNRTARYQSAQLLLHELKELDRSLSDEERRVILVRSVSGTMREMGGQQDAFGTDPNVADTERAARGTNPEVTDNGGVDTQRPIARPPWEFVSFKPALVVLTLIGLLCGLGYLSYKSYLGLRPTEDLRQMSFSRLELPGDVLEAAVSPDGQYLAAVLEDSGGQSIHVREVAHGGGARIVPASGARLRGLTFSPGGEYVYYLESAPETATLFRVPSRGGAPSQLLGGVNTRVTFSPDGRRTAFVRYDTKEQATLLMTADADGTHERPLATFKAPIVFTLGGAHSSGPAWSPDGQVIACPTMNMSDMSADVYVIGVEDGKARRVNAEPWQAIEQIAWLADGGGLLMNGADDPSKRLQVWLLSYPGGQARHVTNDPNYYESVSLTKDASLLVAVKSSQLSTIWVSNIGGSQPARPLPSSKYKGANGIAWMRGGQLVYTSNESRNPDIWVMDADGSNPRQLTADSGANVQPAVAPGGRHIVFVSYRTGTAHVWRMDADGSHQQQLTDGFYEDTPQVSADGRWVIYHGSSSAADSIWRISIDGGEPQRLTRLPSLHPAVSPDGKWLASFSRDDRADAPWKLTVAPVDGRQTLMEFEVPATTDMASQALRWMPDGEALAYVANSGSVSNVWRQPLRGGSASPLTDFKDSQIFAFAFSPDGSQLACVRGTRTNDVVLLRNLK